MCIRDRCSHREFGPHAWHADAKQLLEAVIRELKYHVSPQRVDKWAPKASADERQRLADWACTVTGALNEMPPAMGQYFVNTYAKQMVASH
eukprot:13526634-Alexandrium_andersonii.AAC.1